MSKHRRNKRKDTGEEQPQLQTTKEDGWDTPAFRNEILWTMIFVTLPAIIMFALGEHKFAAGWFGIGLAIVIFESRRQIRSFWHAWRSK